MCWRGRRICATARRWARTSGIPEGLYPGDYLKPVGAALAAEHGPALLNLPESALAAAGARSGDRDDDGGDPRGFGGAQRPPRRVLLGAIADRRRAGSGRRHHRGTAPAGLCLRGPVAAAQGRAGGGLGGPRADLVSRHPVRRRRRSSAHEIGRNLHLFRFRHRLPQIEVRSRLPQPDRCVGGRPRRLCQAHAGGRAGRERAARPSST